MLIPTDKYMHQFSSEKPVCTLNGGRHKKPQLDTMQTSTGCRELSPCVYSTSQLCIYGSENVVRECGRGGKLVKSRMPTVPIILPKGLNLTLPINSLCFSQASTSKVYFVHS